MKLGPRRKVFLEIVKVKELAQLVKLSEIKDIDTFNLFLNSLRPRAFARDLWSDF